VRVDDIVVYQQNCPPREHRRRPDGSVRPTEGLGLCSNLAHPLCRSGKA